MQRDLGKKGYSKIRYGQSMISVQMHIIQLLLTKACVKIWKRQRLEMSIYYYNMIVLENFDKQKYGNFLSISLLDIYKYIMISVLWS